MTAKEALRRMISDSIGTHPVDSEDDRQQDGGTKRWVQGDLATLARELVDKVGFEGAMRYCRSLGWGGVLTQVEKLRTHRS